ncbi:MAG: hypothetical protein H5T91_03245 [Synergistetes bacterium]|nr:hypothetical protein [Synergistota bacterium]MDK2871424.1 manganese transport system substrate-binding protein [bacterium]
MSKLKNFIVLFLILCVHGAVFADESIIKVGASSPLVADLVRSIGGNRVEVAIFPKWEGVKAVFWMGKELEPEVYKRIRALEHIPKVGLLGYVPRIDDNPYEYFDALAIKVFVYRVSKVLKRLDPKGWGYYQRNLSRYSLAIDGVFRDGRWSMANFNEKVVYTLSPHFSYLLKGLGLREKRIAVENLKTVKGVVIDNPEQPLEQPLPKGILLVRLMANLNEELNTYLDLLKENIMTLSLALSQIK